MFQELPFDGYEVHEDGTPGLRVGADHATADNADAQGDGWARYNFLGYEGRDQFYTEYHQVVTTMEDIGEDPTTAAVGRCGRTAATTVSTAPRWR